MKTMQAEYRTDIAQLAAAIAERDAKRDADLAKWRTDMAESMAKLIAMQAEQGAKLIAWQAEQDAKLIAWQAEQDAKLEKRDKSNFQWLVGMWIAFVVVICIIVRWPVG